MVRLNRTYFSLLKFHKQKFFKIWSFGQNSSKLSKIRLICLYTPRTAQNSHRLLTYLYYVQGLPRQRTLRNSSELCKFRAIRPQSPRITQNSHILLTYSTLCSRHLPRQRTLWNSSELRKFCAVRPYSPRITRSSHHLLTLYITFQMPDQWQRTP